MAGGAGRDGRTARGQARCGRVEAARLDGGELKRCKKGDWAKAQIAQRLRQETTVTWGWIARGLVMGASGYAANCVRSFLSGA
jgi:hypothetical protein